jgi:hypothetical protein
MMMKSMRMPVAIVVQIALLLKHGYLVNASPSGAGSCIGGMAAVDLNKTIINNGTLDNGAVEFFINGLKLVPDVTETFSVAGSFVWSLQAAQIVYRGFIVRFEFEEGYEISNEPDVTELGNSTYLYYPEPGSSQISMECEMIGANVTGITHTTNDDKLLTNGTIASNYSGIITIDVTVMFSNNEELGSFYAYNQFKISVLQIMSDAPSLAPFESTVPSSVPSEVPIPIAVETGKPATDAPAAPVTKPPVGVMDKCIKMGKGMSKGKGKGKMSKKDMKSMKGEMDKKDKKGMKGKKGESDDDSEKEEEEESDDARLLKTGGRVTEDPCETEAPSDYPSAAPSDYPSAAPTASPTPAPTSKGKGSGKMDKKDMMAMGDKKSMDGMGDKKSMDGMGGKDSKGKGGKDSKGKGGKGKDDEEETDDEPAPEEPKGKGGKGKGGKGETSAPETSAPETTDAPSPAPTETIVPTKQGKGKGGKGSMKAL